MNQSGSQRWRAALIAIGIMVAVFIAFAPALRAEFVDFDDIDNFVRNEHYRGLGAEQLKWMWTPAQPLFMGHFHPLTWMTLGLDWVIWKDDPRGYHFTSVLLHAINAALVFLIALRLINGAERTISSQPLPRGRGSSEPSPPPSPEGRGRMLIAALATLLWAVHPLRVESVAWITERRDLVNAFFALLAELAYLQTNALRGQKRERWVWLTIMFVLFICSLLGKAMTVTLPAVMLMMDVFPLRRIRFDSSFLSRQTMAVLAEKIPFFAASAFFIWLGVHGQAGGGWLLPWDQHGLLPRLAVSCFGLVFYLWKTIWPAALLPIYEIHLPIDPFEMRFIVAASLAVITMAIALMFRKRWPAFAAAAVCYAIILSPVIGIVQNGMQIAADRYTYLAMIPWMLALGAGLMMLRAARSIVLIAGAVAAVALGTLTWRQCGVWEGTESLWKHVATNDPDSSYGQNSYGFVLLQQGRRDEAIEHFRRAIRIHPTNIQAHVNLWDALGQKGELTAVEVAASEALSNPIVAPYAHYKLGNICLQKPTSDPQWRAQLAEAARVHFEATLAALPDYAQAHNDLAIALQRQGKVKDAMIHFATANKLNPTLPQPRYGLALSMNQLGHKDDAIQLLRELVRDHPEYEPARRELQRLTQQ